MTARSFLKLLCVSAALREPGSDWDTAKVYGLPLLAETTYASYAPKKWGGGKAGGGGRIASGGGRKPGESGESGSNVARASPSREAPK